MLYLTAVVLFVYSQTLLAETQPCDSNKLAAYQVVLHTFWTRDLFPKHYPDWRPPAQWTKLIGKSHNGSYILFRLGQKASPGVKLFTEVGHAEMLEAPGPEVLDEFTAPAIPSGAGRTEVQFFVDGNHSKVSLMSRLMPSPDWFVGIDSFNLCVDGNWMDSVEVEVEPLDAGTDNGFTFTAPNWATSPQGVIYRISSHYPSHPAGSFYYPYLKRLPPIATVQFIKTKEYELNEVFHLKRDNKQYELVTFDQSNSINVINNNDIQMERVNQQLTTKNPISQTKVYTRHAKRDRMIGHKRRLRFPVTSVPSIQANDKLPRVSTGDKEALLNSIVETYHNKDNHRTRRKFRRSRDCQVSDWGEWDTCSKSCGVGEVARQRDVLRNARRGGRPCPPLLETKWCGSAQGCSQHSYYNDW